MSTSASRGLVSIIVSAWNQLEFTSQCIASLKRHTRPPWELIVVDNGSTDHTDVYLAGVRDGAAVPVTVISNASNRGFPAAVNQGLRVARGEYLVLLNNDVVVTDAWIEQLIGLADLGLPTRSPLGLVGPMSNYAAPPQLVENVPYHDIPDMHAFARRWREQHRGTWFNVRKLSGFCLLMKRAAYDAIGGLDERFGLGMFDDDDLAERARRAGFGLAVAHDLFIHHFGSRTFRGNGVDAGKVLDENARRFEEKWGTGAAKGTRVILEPWRGNAEAGRGDEEDLTPRRQDAKNAKETVSVASDDAPAVGERPRVSLTMIVRDEQDNLPHCLESVRGVFDEIVIVDTGSVDRTKEIACEFGTKVFDFVWIDDFAAARNEALAHATGDYVFWLDADDVVEPHELPKLRALLAGLEGGSMESGACAAPAKPRPPGDGAAAYVVRCACAAGPDGTSGETVVDHVRLFPLGPGVRWTYRVHEQILPSLKRAKIPVRWTDLTVRHAGYVDPALRGRKLDRDTRILKRELEERPEDPFVLFNLGAIAADRREWHEAIGFLERSLAGSAPTDSIVRKLYALIARAHQMTGDSQLALRTCAQGLALDPEDAELWFRKGVVHRNRGEPAEAERCWRRILDLKRPDQFCSVDKGIYGHVTRRNLAALAAERGDEAEARRLWTEALAERPGDREALSKLERLRKEPALGGAG